MHWVTQQPQIPTNTDIAQIIRSNMHLYALVGHATCNTQVSSRNSYSRTYHDGLVYAIYNTNRIPARTKRTLVLTSETGSTPRCLRIYGIRTRAALLTNALAYSACIGKGKTHSTHNNASDGKYQAYVLRMKMPFLSQTVHCGTPQLRKPSN